MIDQAHQEERPIRQILYLGDLLETCHFQAFWAGARVHAPTSDLPAKVLHPLDAPSLSCSNWIHTLHFCQGPPHRHPQAHLSPTKPLSPEARVLALPAPLSWSQPLTASPPFQALDENMDLLEGITGFEDSVRKFICHVVGITYQHIDRWLLAEMLGDLTDSQLKVWMSKYGWSADESGQIFICSQEESIKPKNIVEKIDFDSVSSIMASSQ
ncbi:eukaryotic translation initiation factor 3 subunit K isoform X3 [Leptonychotes weddellii]|nr:eukaryotic translation initiation factor 3 subunit K isoform X3 [Leptonychotes weddellii]